MSRVYLAGGINGLSDREARGWREDAKQWLTTETSDPMDRDYRGREGQNYTEIVEDDLHEIRNSDLLLVMAPRPSWGTAMEIRYAWEREMPVYVVVPDEIAISPWLMYHATEVFPTLESAVTAINEEAEFERGT